jgi:[ribosomal protein S5]-alanine N-acetyltransferase
MEPLATERLVIRNFSPADSEALQEMILQYEASGLAQYDHPWPSAPEEVRGVTQWFASGDYFLAVCLKDSNRFIGFVGLNPEPGENERLFNLGYIFNFDFHGRGYATEACRAVLRRAFGQLQADRVVSGTAVSNQASWRVIRSCPIFRPIVRH